MKAVLTAVGLALLMMACGSQPATAQAGTDEMMPKAVELVQPNYPEGARKAGIEGTSIVEVTIGTDGAMVRCSLAASSGNSQLDEAALQAVHVSKFAAGTRNGKPVEMTIKVPFKFKLADKQKEQRGRVQAVPSWAEQYEPALPAMEV